MSTDSKAGGLRVAIFGCGRMGQQHARTTVALGHRVSVVCDVDEARAAALASQHPGCIVVTDAAAVPWDQVDAAFLCTPPFARGPVELAAAQAGVPFFLEKPIGLSATQCLPAMEVVRARGLVTSVGYMNRYRGSVARVRQVLDTEPALGFAAHWVCAAYRVPWWGQPSLSGGQINEQCTHLIDLARYLGGEIAQVHAFAQPGADGAGDPSAAVLLRFETGALGTVICASQATEKQIGCRVFTPRGQLVLDGWDFKWAPSAAFGDDTGLDPREDIFLAEGAAFLDAVRTGDTSRIKSDLADAMRTQQVVDAIRRSIGEGRPRSMAPSGLEGEHTHAAGFV